MSDESTFVLISKAVRQLLVFVIAKLSTQVKVYDESFLPRREKGKQMKILCLHINNFKVAKNQEYLIFYNSYEHKTKSRKRKL